MAEPVNLKGVREARAAAKKVGGKPAAPPPDDAGTSTGTLPPDCPVRPLGKDESFRYYLDADRQLRVLSDRDHTRLGILSMFGQRSDLLYAYWPRMTKEGEVTGWRPEMAAEVLMGACSAAGVWDAAERQRGRGAWLGQDGALVLHTGGHVMTFPSCPNPWDSHTSVPAGLVGRYVYSAASSTGMPWHEPVVSGPDGPGAALFDLLSTWRWRRGPVDAMLLLGWIGASMIGGALQWRPMVWLTGGKGTGKSTLQALLKAVFSGGIIQAADTTGAGLWQALRFQTLPVAVDELEADEDNRKSLAIVKFARVASSGGMLLRGGADHRGQEFVVRSSMMFSSILIPPLAPQDRSRISVLDLLDLDRGAPSPVLDSERLATWSAQLRRRLVDGWHRLPTVLESYRQALQHAGHTARGADQLGTLLACANVMLHDDDRADRRDDAWVRQLTAHELAEADDNARDETLCLSHLLSSPLDAYRSGIRKSVAEWVRQAAGLTPGLLDADIADAGKVLGTYGLRLLPAKAPGDVATVAVANHHQGLAALFAGTHWAGRSGTMGVWVQAMRRLPGATRGGSTYFAGAVSKATLVPLDVIVPVDAHSNPAIGGT